MSGQTRDSSPGSGAFRSSEISCDKLGFECQLHSPNPAVVPQLSVGDLLTIQLTQGARLVAEAYWHGQVAGSILSAQLQKFLDCLQQGYSYQATVLSITGGSVRVRVMPV